MSYTAKDIEKELEQARRDGYNEGAREQQALDRKRFAEIIRGLKDQGYQKASSPSCHHRVVELRCDNHRLIREAMDDAWRIAALVIERGP